MSAVQRLHVLVVEDDPNKKQKLFEFLQSRKDLFEEPEICVSAADAVKRMQVREYDLLILDLNIPNRFSQPASEQHAMDLLDQIDGGHAGVRRPRFVLPMSSMGSISDEAKEFFRGRPWGIVAYDEGSAQALLDIESVAVWISQQGKEAPSLCDVFLITALEDPEFSAVEAAGLNFGPLQPLDSKQLVRFGAVLSQGREISVAAAFCPRMGPEAAALLTSKVAEKLRPRLVIMAGICASTSDKAGIGDVVAAELCWDWQSGKYVNDDGEEDFLISPHQLDIDLEERAALVKFRRDAAFWAGFAADSQKLNVPLPKLVIGPVATGASVLADERVVTRIRKQQHRSMVALDMETYGVFAAAQAASHRMRALSMKAVCDKGDKQKNDEFQSYAAKVSALSARYFLEKYGPELLGD